MGREKVAMNTLFIPFNCGVLLLHKRSHWQILYTLIFIIIIYIWLNIWVPNGYEIGYEIYGCNINHTWL